MYIADGDYIKDIEVNDLRNRYTLTKGATQKMVNTDPLPGYPLTLLTTLSPFPPPSLFFVLGILIRISGGDTFVLMYNPACWRKYAKLK